MNRSAMLGRRVLLLAELDYAGGLVLSTEAAEIDRAAGGTVVVHGVLDELSFSQQLDTPGSIGEFDGVSISGKLPVGVARLAAAGVPLELTTARISRWADGQTWEERELLFRGLVGDPEYGEDEDLDIGRAADPVSFSIEPEEVIERTPCVPVDAVVDARTWTDSSDEISEAELGRAYPFIIGRPGCAPWYSGGMLSGSVGVWVRKLSHWHKLVIAGHPVKATTVWINSDVTTSPEEVAVTHEADALGRTVATVDFHATDTTYPIEYYDVDGNLLTVVDSTTPAVDEALDVYVSWPDAGGLMNSAGDELRGAGDVLAWALGQCDAPVDLARCIAVAPRINHILIDGAIEVGNVSMWEWITRQLLPLLPVSIEDGADGRYPVVWPYEATDRDVVAVLDLDEVRDAEVGRIRVDSSGIRNEFRIKYGLSRRLGQYQRSHILGAYEEEYATATLRGPRSETIVVEMRALGANGDGTTIEVTAGGALAVGGSIPDREISVVFNDGVSTGVAIANALRTLTALVRSVTLKNDSGWFWTSSVSGGNEQTATAALHRTRGAAGSLACDVSQRRYARPSDPGGRRVVLEEIETDYLMDDASAASVCRWKAAALALAVRRLDVALPEDRWGHLRRAQVIRVRSSTLHLDDLAMIEHPELHGDGVVAYTLRFIEDPFRYRVTS